MKALKIATIALFGAILFACKQQSQTGNDPTIAPLPKRQPGAQATLVERGKAVYDETGCATCHAIGGIGGTIGPKLDRVGKKYDDAKLREILLNPQILNPNTTMQPFEGSEEDLEALVAYLKSLK